MTCRVSAVGPRVAAVTFVGELALAGACARPGTPATPPSYEVGPARTECSWSEAEHASICALSAEVTSTPARSSVTVVAVRDGERRRSRGTRGGTIEAGAGGSMTAARLQEQHDLASA